MQGLTPDQTAQSDIEKFSPITIRLLENTYIFFRKTSTKNFQLFFSTGQKFYYLTSGMQHLLNILMHVNMIKNAAAVVELFENRKKKWPTELENKKVGLHM